LTALDNSININLSNKERFLVESLFIYNSLYNNRADLSKGYESSALSLEPNRKDIFQILSKAILHNNEILWEIIQSIKSSCTIDDIIKFGFYQSKFHKESNDLHSYLKDYKYLRRDWSGLIQGEKEVMLIVDPIRTQIEKHLTDYNQALFIGAGLGRIAWEHNDLFNIVNAIDKSYSMVYLFHKLLNEEIKFYEVNESNIYKAKDAVKMHTASIHNGSKKAYENRSSFNYTIGDVMDLPYANDSQSLVASIYFTDVLALKLYINEIIRVLKIGGLYIHFGPLAYFFSDVREHLSAEEITLLFQSYGFEILHDELIEVPFMPVSYGLLKTIQNNWFFVARKRDTSKDFYEIEKPIYSRTVKIVNENATDDNVELITKTGKVFENARDVLKILEYFRDGKQLNKVIEEIEQDFPQQNIESITKIISILINEKLIKNKNYDSK